MYSHTPQPAPPAPEAGNGARLITWTPSQRTRSPGQALPEKNHRAGRRMLGVVALHGRRERGLTCRETACIGLLSSQHRALQRLAWQLGNSHSRSAFRPVVLRVVGPHAEVLVSPGHVRHGGRTRSSRSYPRSAAMSPASVRHPADGRVHVLHGRASPQHRPRRHSLPAQTRAPCRPPRLVWPGRPAAPRPQWPRDLEQRLRGATQLRGAGRAAAAAARCGAAGLGSDRTGDSCCSGACCVGGPKSRGSTAMTPTGSSSRSAKPL